MTKTIDHLLDLILEHSYMAPTKYSSCKIPSDNPEHPLSIIVASDGDMHLLPVMKQVKDDSFFVTPLGNILGCTEVLSFSIDQESSFLNKSIFVLAEAIRRDNAKNGFQNDIEMIDSLAVIKAFNEMSEVSCRFETLTENTYARVQDDNDGDNSSTLQVDIKDNKVTITLNSLHSLRFRTFCGGGKSPRIRNALHYIAYLSLK